MLSYGTAGVDFEEAGEKWRGGDAVKVRPRITDHVMKDLTCHSQRGSSFEQLSAMTRL